MASKMNLEFKKIPPVTWRACEAAQGWGPHPLRMSWWAHALAAPSLRPPTPWPGNRAAARLRRLRAGEGGTQRLLEEEDEEISCHLVQIFMLEFFFCNLINILHNFLQETSLWQ